MRRVATVLCTQSAYRTDRVAGLAELGAEGHRRRGREGDPVVVAQHAGVLAVVAQQVRVENAHTRVQHLSAVTMQDLHKT